MHTGFPAARRVRPRTHAGCDPDARRGLTSFSSAPRATGAKIRAMRLSRRAPAPLVLAALAVPVVSGGVAAPAVAATTPDACEQALNPDRRSTYRFKDGDTTLGFGRVVVTATKANRDRYCIQVQFGGRTVFNGFGMSSYERRDGKWVNEGGLGDSGSRGASYTQSMQVPNRTRIDRSYSIRHEGRWYRTGTISRTNL